MRVSYYLNELEIKIISEKMKEHGMVYEKDFEKYFQKVLSHEIEKSGFTGCDTFTCAVKKKEFRSPATKKKIDFLQCLANENSTTISSAISVLLLKGFQIKP